MTQAPYVATAAVRPELAPQLPFACYTATWVTVPTRLILHADMDAFFASVEQRDNPELRGKPVIVGGAGARGVVAAASYEARRYGVRSAMPGFRARQLCPGAVFVAGNLRRYAAVSTEIHEVFQQFSPVIEPLALDEAFLDVSGSLGLFASPTGLGHALKSAVLSATGLVVSVGIGPNKFVAKLACSESKPDGLLCVEAERAAAFVGALPLRRLLGAGPKLVGRLEALGLRTLAELAAADLRALQSVLGHRAEAFRSLARGIDPRPVVVERAVKSVGEENTFDRDVRDRATIERALQGHASAVAARLRERGLLAATVTLKVRLSRRAQAEPGPPASIATPLVSQASGQVSRHELYPFKTRSLTLRSPTDDGSALARAALRLWERSEIAEPVRLVGVSVSKLQPQQEAQLDLFPQTRPRVGPTLDAINKRFGRGAIRQGG